MRLNKRELSLKLNVSEATLTNWQREGMPVLEHGSRGKPGVYDFAAVVRWMRQTGYGSRAKNPAHQVDLDALERELLALPAPAPAGGTQFPDPRTIDAIEAAQVARLVEAAAWLVHFFRLTPLQALQCVQIVDFELCSAFEDAHGFDKGPDPCEGDYVLAQYPDTSSPVVAKVAARAAQLGPADFRFYEHYFRDEVGNPLPAQAASQPHGGAE